jgi:hypothetical protein
VLVIKVDAFAAGDFSRLTGVHFYFMDFQWSSRLYWIPRSQQLIGIHIYFYLYDLITFKTKERR